MNSRTVYYVVETEAKLEEHRYNNPGRILLCDRTYIQDTPKGRYIKGTHELHEVQSFATSETIPTWPANNAPREWPVLVSDLICTCLCCTDDTNYVPCKFEPWHNTREVIMQEVPRYKLPVSGTQQSILPPNSTPLFTLGSNITSNSTSNITISTASNNNDTIDNSDDTIGALILLHHFKSDFSHLLGVYNLVIEF